MAEAKHNYSISDSVSLSPIDLQGDRAVVKQVHRVAFERNSESALKKGEKWGCSIYKQ